MHNSAVHELNKHLISQEQMKELFCNDYYAVLILSMKSPV
jgi:hypothetical protein